VGSEMCIRDSIKGILKSNPFGNDDQKTPLIVIKFLNERAGQVPGSV